MAGRARGWLLRTWCADVRLMAIGAAARDGAVLRRAFAHVAACARRRSGDRARVRLVTIRAFEMPARRAAGFFLVAALAGRGLCAAVRFVTLGALRVPGFDLRLFPRMTRAARGEQRCRAVREPAVTVGAQLMTRAERDAAQLLRVTVSAQAEPGLLE